MQKHTKTYFKYHGYCKEDIILCELCGAVAVDIHHIILKSQGGDDNIDNLIALDRKCHEMVHCGSINLEICPSNVQNVKNGKTQKSTQMIVRKEMDCVLVADHVTQEQK